MLEKKKIHVFNNDYYLLGADNEGTKYYLQCCYTCIIRRIRKYID